MFAVPSCTLNTPLVYLLEFVVQWSLEFHIFETVPLQDRASGDRSDGSECISAERAWDLGRKEWDEFFTVYYILFVPTNAHTHTHTHIYIYKY